jgi:hypothetical protein
VAGYFIEAAVSTGGLIGDLHRIITPFVVRKLVE